MSFQINTVAAIEHATRQLFADSLRGTGVVALLDAWLGPADCLVALRSAPGSPDSGLRQLVRGIAHARADAIVTTADDLRQSPGRGEPVDPILHRTLQAWRHERLGRERAAVTLVLDPRGELDLDHPALAGSGRRLIYTDLEGQWGLESRAADQGIEVVADGRPDLLGAIRLLRRELGAATLVLETAPQRFALAPGADLQTVRPLIDELMLVVCEAPRLPSGAEGSWILPLGDLHAAFPNRPEPYRGLPPDDEWSIYRWSR